ncbi:MAG: dihydropteroate synthase [Nitrosomonas sp.]
MGVVNVTPDSFSDGGLYYSADKAIAHAQKLIDEGADILDIGGESTRPGSQSVSVEEELDRVMPVIDSLVKRNIAISIDTSKAEVMKQAINAGVCLINDVNAFRNPGTFELVSPFNHVDVCLMHMQGTPIDMQNNPQYGDIVTEVKTFLQQRIEAARLAGISQDRIIIDPGFGFGKLLQHNFALLKNLNCLAELNVPILVGISRKSMLGKVTGNAIDQRIHESISAAVLAVVKGAKIVRVHDVKATKDALAVYTAMQNVI